MFWILRIVMIVKVFWSFRLVSYSILFDVLLRSRVFFCSSFGFSVMGANLFSLRFNDYLSASSRGVGSRSKSLAMQDYRKRWM
jgi:hypothetical protein